MKRAYVKPAMVSYDRSEIMEMIGPVKTQYVPPPPPRPPPPPPPIECVACADVRVEPNAFLQGKVFDAQNPLRLTLDTPCPEFERVRIAIPGSSPYLEFEFKRSDGSFSGNKWSVDIVGFQFLGDRGDYPVVVTLYDAQGRFLSSCQTTITVE